MGKTIKEKARIAWERDLEVVVCLEDRTRTGQIVGWTGHVLHIQDCDGGNHTYGYELIKDICCGADLGKLTIQYNDTT